ncbi:MAG: uracil-DNA glycosylase, partial [Crocinitomicaceae bacterium]|nr:uracil-DNA glycosylase [Crocinitomicaceae bacterium]
MDVRIEDSWKEELSEEFEKPYFNSLTEFVKQEYSTHKCYPPAKQIFAAFDSAPFYKVRVVIIGQDPYHGPGQANGLCFSVNDGVEHPPSLKNIFKELKEEGVKEIPQSGDLSGWAKQGVLLLNASLSVRAGMAGSHQNKGWEQFTDTVISTISAEKEGVIFLLWGKFAQNKQ